jgi:hypothetical protein
VHGHDRLEGVDGLAQHHVIGRDPARSFEQAVRAPRVVLAELVDGAKPPVIGLDGLPHAKVADALAVHLEAGVVIGPAAEAQRAELPGFARLRSEHPANRTRSKHAGAQIYADLLQEWIDS